MIDNACVTPDNEAAWLAERRNSIGSSDSPAILGVSPFATPLDVWQRKLGLAPEQDENEAMSWGKKLEPLILAEYTAQTGREIQATQRFVRHEGLPFVTATLDGLTTDGRIVEVKTTSAWAREWGEDGTDQIPEAYLVQVHHQMACIGLGHADVAVLIGGQRFRLFSVQRNDDLIDLIRTRAAEFWQCVQSRTPPDWGRMDARTLAVLNPGCEGTVDLDESIVEKLVAFEQAAEFLKDIEERRDRNKSDVLRALGNAQFGRLPDGRLVKRFLQDVAASTRTVTTKAHKRHYFRIVKGDS